MKFPEDIQKQLIRRFRSKHRDWLAASINSEHLEHAMWPLEINLSIPTEREARQQFEDVQAWVAAWRSWHGCGSIQWIERHWPILGTQCVPGKLVLGSPADVAQWSGETDRWNRAQQRFAEFIACWPQLADTLPRYFHLLADYDDSDFQRLIKLIDWIEKNPSSGLYPRQLPVSGLDTKWLENRKSILANLVAAVRCECPDEKDFYQLCGLVEPQSLIRSRILDDSLRKQVGGLGDISVPWEQLARVDLPATKVIFVENLQTGLAFGELPGAVVIMRLGYAVDVLDRLPWATNARCFYWGDIDTHGFAILNRARSYIPKMKSLLMDEETLRDHQHLWVEEKTQCSAEALPLLTDSEQKVYQALKRNTWGQNIRLEQERIAWDVAWRILQSATT